jgi:hypothetical protein
MVLTEEYDIVPANNSCSNQINKNKIISTPGTSTHANQVHVNATENQHIEDSKYDNVDNMNVKPLYGGIKKNNNKYYKIHFNNKIKKYKAKSEKDAINIFLSNNEIPNNYLLEICCSNKKKESLYLIKIK